MKNEYIRNGKRDRKALKKRKSKTLYSVKKNYRAEKTEGK